MRSDSKRLIGWAIVAVGAISLIDSLFGDSGIWNFLWKLWPFVLIAVGIYIIRNQNRFKAGVDSGGLNSDSRVFGDLDISMSGAKIQNHQFSTLIGDINLDLSRARFESGEKKVGVTVLIGDARITVPEDVPVRLSSQCLLGDIEFDDFKKDGFFQKLDRADDGFESSEKRLHLNVTGLIGDLEINRKKADDDN